MSARHRARFQAAAGRSSRLLTFAALAALLLPVGVRGAAPARADLLPEAEADFTEPLKLTFEILPARDGTSLPDDIRRIEGARMQVEEFREQTGEFLKMTVVLPLPDGEHRERVVFFRHEDGRLRMLGFHSLVRRTTGPEGMTIVFDSGAANPLTGRKITLPRDSYSRLGLFAALRGLAASGGSGSLTLWTRDGEAVNAKVTSDGEESFFLFGADVETRRLRVVPEGGVADAVYWFAAKPPHTFLQYEGPADFMTVESPDARIVLRATSSSEHSLRLLEGLGRRSDG